MRGVIRGSSHQMQHMAMGQGMASCPLPAQHPAASVPLPRCREHQNTGGVWCVTAECRMGSGHEGCTLPCSHMLQPCRPADFPRSCLRLRTCPPVPHVGGLWHAAAGYHAASGHSVCALLHPVCYRWWSLPTPHVPLPHVAPCSCTPHPPHMPCCPQPAGAPGIGCGHAGKQGAPLQAATWGAGRGASAVPTSCSTWLWGGVQPSAHYLHGILPPHPSPHYVGSACSDAWLQGATWEAGTQSMPQSVGGISHGRRMLQGQQLRGGGC